MTGMVLATAMCERPLTVEIAPNEALLLVDATVGRWRIESARPDRLQSRLTS